MDELKKYRFSKMSKENGETTPMSHVAGQGRTDREANSDVIPKQQPVFSGARNLEAKRKARASGGTSVPRADGKQKKRAKSQLKPMPGVPIGDDSDNCEEVLMIKKISEVEFRRTKETNELKIGSSTGKVENEDNNRGLVSLKLASHDPDQGSPDKSRSFPQTGNDDDNMDLEVSDEARFGNTKTHNVSKIGSTPAQENVADGSKKISSAREEDECGNKEWVSGNAFLGDVDIRADGPGPEMNTVIPGDDVQVDEDINQKSNNNIENLPNSSCPKVAGTGRSMLWFGAPVASPKFLEK